MKLLFKYPTRSRPAWFKTTLDLYQTMLSGKHDCRFVISIDSDDATMNNPEMKDYMRAKEVSFHINPPAGKIAAINADLVLYDFDIVIAIADDMTPILRGYDDVIVQDMIKNYPDLNGAIHYSDGAGAGACLCVLPVIGRKLYDQFGYIYWPEYKSLWCDNEQTDVFREMGVMKWIEKVVIRHDFRKHGNDEVYKVAHSNWHWDQMLYEKRKELGFPRKPTSYLVE